MGESETFWLQNCYILCTEVTIRPTNHASLLRSQICNFPFPTLITQCVKIQLYQKKSGRNLLSVARLFHQGCSVDMFRWICFKKHDSGCIFRMIYIDKPFKYTLPCPDMILQVASMAASAWCYHCSPYPSYTQWRFRGFLHVYFAYFVCFSAIFILFMFPWIYGDR